MIVKKIFSIGEIIENSEFKIIEKYYENKDPEKAKELLKIMNNKE